LTQSGVPPYPEVSHLFVNTAHLVSSVVGSPAFSTLPYPKAEATQERSGWKTLAAGYA